MSFRIDSILKKEEPLGSFGARCSDIKYTTVREEARGVKLEDVNSAGSILHQTLLNRPQPGCYRSTDRLNEGCNAERASTSLYGQGSDWLYLPQRVYYPYFKTENPYLYPRKYSMYNTSLPAYPLHYSHYLKRKGGQVRFTPNQTATLEKRFLSNKYLSPEDRKRLADTLKLSDRQVKTWFQNRRAKWKRSNSGSSVESTTDIDKDRNVQNEILNNISC